MITHGNSTVAQNISCLSVLDAENRIDINVFDNSPTAIAAIKEELFDHAAVSFSKAIQPVTLTANINCGDAVSETQGGSVGWRARNDGRDGFVTAGHATVARGKYIL